MSTSEPVRTTLQDRIYTRLREDILNAEIVPGASLRVLHLAARFGTSQAPVREALRRLTEEGLAATIPYRGTVAREPSWNEIADIYLLREELEAFSVKRILARPKWDRSDLLHAQKNLNRAVRIGDPLQVLDADLEFHRQVVAQADSPLTLEMWLSLIKRQRGARLSLERKHPADIDSVVRTHQVLIDALCSGDPTTAENAFREHIQSGLSSLALRHTDTHNSE